jgi:protein dithiol:quinone oxidoreductase
MKILALSKQHAAALIATLSFGAVALALVLQHGFNMQPCAWCTVQRLVYLLIGAIALVAILPINTLSKRTIMCLIFILSGTGVVAALYQHFVASESASCALSFADKMMIKSGLDGGIPWLFQATATCQNANIPLAGVPFALWSLLLFVILGGLALQAALNGRK